MSETKKKKKRNVRTPAERLAAAKRKVSEMEAKQALAGMVTAVKDGRVSEDNEKEYRKLLRYMKVMEKAPGVFAEFGMTAESEAAANLRDTLIGSLKKLVTGEPVEKDEDEDEEEEEEEPSEEEEEEEEEEDDDDDDDDDDDEDEDDDDFEDDDGL